MSNYKAITLLLFAVLLQVSCVKQSPRNKLPTLDFELTNSGKILIDKNWREVTVEVINHQEDKNQSKNITGQFNRSDLDDLMIFLKDGTYKFEEGQSKLSTESKQVYEIGNWFLDGDQLVLETEESRTNYIVKKISPNTLILALPVKYEDYHYLITYQSI